MQYLENNPQKSGPSAASYCWFWKGMDHNFLHKKSYQIFTYLVPLFSHNTYHCRGWWAKYWNFCLIFHRSLSKMLQFLRPKWDFDSCSNLPALGRFSNVFHNVKSIFLCWSRARAESNWLPPLNHRYVKNFRSPCVLAFLFHQSKAKAALAAGAEWKEQKKFLGAKWHWDQLGSQQVGGGLLRFFLQLCDAARYRNAAQCMHYYKRTCACAEPHCGIFERNSKYY